MNQSTELSTLIPNWQRFVNMYHPEDALIEAFTERIYSIESNDIRARVAWYINIELGVLMLSHHEIDNKKMREILSLAWHNE
jgi:hypothetical protein